ncbi:MAG TPA: SEL1-like repeat protein [Gammaproteobacteria bacterium]|nr:SEL1-like repeat protein [Gammaproteobacteria bacterium]
MPKQILLMFYRGDGVERNDKIALQWLKKAAE